MGEIPVGTCSWTDPTLIASGRFYPQWARSAEARLQYYAGKFAIVEVDNSYYSLKLLFDVKAFRLFTQHPTPQQALPRDIRQALPSELKEKANVYLRDLPDELTDEIWRRFERALLPLDSAAKLRRRPLPVSTTDLPGK